MLPYYRVCTHDKFWSRIPLMVSDIVMSLQPNPLLAFCEESVIAGFPFPVLHYYKMKQQKGASQDANFGIWSKIVYNICLNFLDRTLNIKSLGLLELIIQGDEISKWQDRINSEQTIFLTNNYLILL